MTKAHMIPRVSRRRTLTLRAAALAAALLAGAASGAPRDDKAGKYYEDALARYEKKDIAGAIVQLKNALQQDPRMLQAYLLLGKAQMRDGDPAAAEDAFANALRLGVNRAEVVVLLGQAYLQQAKQEILLDRLPPEGLPAATRAEVLALRAHAQMELGNFAAAERSLDEARTLAPQTLSVLGAQAVLAQRRGDVADAVKLADQALALAPTDPKAWHLKASVAHSAGDARGALTAYERAIALDADYFDARIARLALLLDLGRDEDVARELAALKAQRPNEPRAAYLRAVLAGRRGDQVGAHDALAELTRLVDPIPADVIVRYPQLVLLGAVAHYGLGGNEKAKAYLEMLIKLDSRHVGARKLLGSLLISTGKTRDAIAVLEPAQRQVPNDPYTLSLLATAYMGEKRYSRATELLDQAVRLGGSTPVMSADLGLSLLGTGQEAGGIEQLQRTFSKDPGQARAGVALAVLHLRRGQAKAAVEVMDAVVRRDPGNLVAVNLLGVARAAAGDNAGARTAYDKAVAQDRAFIPARLNLAKLDFAEGKHAQARERLSAILKEYPKNSEAMFELARVEEGAGRLDEAVRWAEKARDHDRRSVTPGLYLTELYLRRGDKDKALGVAKELVAFFPDNVRALAALGRVHLAMGDLGNARSAFTRMTRMAEFDVDWQYEIARLQVSADHLQGALYSLEKALSNKPDHLPSLILAAELELRTGEVAKAENRARYVLNRYPGQAVGHRLLADVAMARKNYADAISGYRTALAKEDTVEAAVRVLRAYIQSGNAAKGTEFMESWVRGHAADATALRALAEGYLRAGNLRAARAQYEAVLKRQGDDANVLNNLANILARLGDPAALTHAEKAYRLAPNDATVNDTLGWVLVQQGQVDKGLRHLRDARLRQPENAEIRYHLAAALTRVGRREEARRELEQALKESSGFDGVDEARKLMRDLGRR